MIITSERGDIDELRRAGNRYPNATHAKFPPGQKPDDQSFTSDLAPCFLSTKYRSFDSYLCNFLSQPKYIGPFEGAAKKEARRNSARNLF